MVPILRTPPNGKVPHDDIAHCPVHINYRLAGSLPTSTLQTLSRKRASELSQLESKLIGLPPEVYAQAFNRGAGQINARYELAIDSFLDTSRNGPFHLKQPRIAGLVMDAWMHLHQRNDIVVFALCIMGNHVHVVLEAPPRREKVSISKLMQSHKSFTARQANEILRRTGQPFWEKDYFDRRVRKGKFMRVMWYVLNNPVKAGLVNDWEEWPHIYVHPECLPMFTGRLPD